MKQSVVFLCFAAGLAHALLKDLTNIVDKVGEVIPDSINPLKLVYVNRCIEDLGCFSTAPPFFDAVNRPLSLLPTEKPRIRFLLYTPQKPKHKYLLKMSKKSLQKSRFDSKLLTKIIIHGFLSDLGPDDIRFTTKDSLLKIGNFNVIIVDWTKMNGYPYEQAVANTRVVGALVAKMIHFLMNETGITAESVHVIGHSLGGQTAGYVGERVPNLGRITGLDPAGPYFYLSPPEVRLDPTDALFVDVIHTDGAEFIFSGLGTSAPVGHMDFYPNGGRRQPGCGLTVDDDGVVGEAINFTTKWALGSCDHSRANLLFNESIDATSCQFKAVLCDSYKDFEKGQCPPDTSTQAQMGFHAKRIESLEPPLRFFLRTNKDAPYCNENSVYL